MTNLSLGISTHFARNELQMYVCNHFIYEIPINFNFSQFFALYIHVHTLLRNKFQNFKFSGITLYVSILLLLLSKICSINGCIFRLPWLKSLMVSMLQRDSRPEYLFSAWYLHTFPRKRVLTDGQTDGQQCDPIRVTLFPFDSRNPKNDWSSLKSKIFIYFLLKIS